MTYSIVARDADSGAIGVATQSHFFAAGGLVCWAEPGVGAVASQSFADPSLGSTGLELMSRDVGAPDSLRALLLLDEGREFRQVAMIDSTGDVGVHTGSSCIQYAGHAVGDGVCALGNMLRNDRTWDAMLISYQESQGDLADRLIAALRAAEAAGGDIRGRQAAGIRIVASERGPRPWQDLLLDLRVEDHEDPVEELARLVDYKRAFDRVAGVIFAEGLILGEFREPTDGSLEKALGDLEMSAAELGDSAEPDLWRTILLARAGRNAEASAALERAAMMNPALYDFVRRLPDAGFLSTDHPLLTYLNRGRSS